MGAGGIRIESNKVGSLLISLTKLEEFTYNFNPDENGKMSNILFPLIKGTKKIFQQIDELKRIYEKTKINTIHELLKFILETLHKELSGSEIDFSQNYSSYDEIINLFKRENSIIRNLFFGINTNKKTCCNCNNEIINYQIFALHKKYNLPENRVTIDVQTLTKEFIERNIIEKSCIRCQKKTKTIITSEIYYLPEIFVMVLDDLDNCILDFACSTKIKNQKYKLVGFIHNKNENNQITEYPNVFYKEKGKWFIYKIYNSEKKEISKIKEISGNPSVIFYQNDKKEFNDFYNKINLFLKDKENIKELLNEHLVEGIEYEKYYVLKKDWYNKLLKMYESDNNYNDNNYIVDSMKKVPDLTGLNFDEINSKYLKFNKRKEEIQEENLFRLEYESIKNLEEKYPKNFDLIKKNILDDALNAIDIPLDNFKKYLYEILMGENYLFVKENNKEIIYVYYLNENNFEIAAILNYNQKTTFIDEMKKYIYNRGGLEYYYYKRSIKLELNKKQKIINREKDEIGYLVNIGDLKNIMNMHKYNPKYKNEEKKNDYNDSMVKNSQFSNKNYGNSLDNQLKVPTNLLFRKIQTIESENQSSSGANNGAN